MVHEIKITSLAEIWYQYYFEYVKFDGGVHLFCFGPFFPSFAEKIH